MVLHFRLVISITRSSSNTCYKTYDKSAKIPLLSSSAIVPLILKQTAEIRYCNTGVLNLFNFVTVIVKHKIVQGVLISVTTSFICQWNENIIFIYSLQDKAKVYQYNLSGKSVWTQSDSLFDTLIYTY